MITQHSAAPTRTAVNVLFNPWLHWRLATESEPQVLTVAELADCHCPDLCDRDHGNE
jgi:hypothetical protein